MGTAVHNDARWTGRFRITEGYATVKSNYIIPMPLAGHTPRAIIKPFAAHVILPFLKLTSSCFEWFFKVWLGLVVSAVLVVAPLAGLLERVGAEEGRQTVRFVQSRVTID